MEKMIEILNTIKELSEKEQKSLPEMVLKLVEEVGEVSQAILSVTSASGSEYKNITIEDFKEECVDVLLVILSLFYKVSKDENELYETLNKKIEKWKKVTSN